MVVVSGAAPPPTASPAGAFSDAPSLAGGATSVAGFAALSVVTSAAGVLSAGVDDLGVPHPASARTLQVAIRSLVSLMVFSVKDRRTHSPESHHLVACCPAGSARYVGIGHDML
jgi:hypothetical protein